MTEEWGAILVVGDDADMRESAYDETTNVHPMELFEVTVAEPGETRQYYRWVTKAERFQANQSTGTQH